MTAFVPGVRGGDTLIPALGPWPKDPLWVCAVSEHRLERTVFGKDAEAEFASAVQASCAIPGLIRSPEIDGVHYLDGGIHSPTNADLLVESGVEVAVISSPMSGAHGAAHPMRPLIRWSSRRLSAEVDSLRDAGIEPVIIEPDLEGRRRMGHAMLSSRHRRRAVGAAIDTAGSATARLRR